VCERYDDPRIRRLFHDENQSLSKRLNEGVAATKGEFVAVLYSDDWMLSDKIARQVRMFEKLPDDYGVVYCPALGFNHHTGETWQHPSFALNGVILPSMLERHFSGPIDMSSPLTRREAFVRYPFYEDLRFEGEAVFMRIALAYRFHFDPDPTVVLRDIGTNIGKAIQPNHEMSMEVMARLKAMPEVPRSLHQTIERFSAEILKMHAWVVIRTDPDQAAWSKPRFLQAIKFNPKNALSPRLITGLVLASLPRRLRHRANGLGNKMRKHPANRSLVEKY